MNTIVTENVGEKSVIKIHHKQRSAFVGYLYIMDLIKAQNMELIKMFHAMFYNISIIQMISEKPTWNRTTKVPIPQC